MKRYISIILLVFSTTTLILIAACGNAKDPLKSKSNELNIARTPDELIIKLEQSINSNNRKDLELLVSNIKIASAFEILLGKNVIVSSKSPLIGRNEKYSYIDEYDSNQMGKEKFSVKETNHAFAILNISTRNSGANPFTVMKKFSDGWKIFDISFLYLDFPNAVTTDFTINNNFFGFGVPYNSGLDKKISKIDFYDDDNQIICSSEDVNYRIIEDQRGKILLVNVKCNFKNIYKNLQKQKSYVLMKLMVYLTNGEKMEGVYLNELSKA